MSLNSSTSEQAIMSPTSPLAKTPSTCSMLEQLTMTTMSRSAPVLFRTTEMMAKSKLILKMPTITQSQRVILKILPTQSQLPWQQLPVHQPAAPQTSQLSMPEKPNTVPRIIETPCGQFNTESSSDVYRKSTLYPPEQCLNQSPIHSSSPLSVVRLISVDLTNTDNMINGFSNETTLIDCASTTWHDTWQT